LDAAVAAAMSTTVRSSSSVTPRDGSERAALRDREGGKVVSTRSAVSINRTRDCAESMERKSPRRVLRASSAIWPAISTPVGPAPTTTKVSSARRLAGTGSVSASSNALRTRARVARALSSDLTSGAKRRQSSWPKYAAGLAGHWSRSRSRLLLQSVARTARLITLATTRGLEIGER